MISFSAWSIGSFVLSSRAGWKLKKAGMKN